MRVVEWAVVVAFVSTLAAPASGRCDNEGRKLEIEKAIREFYADSVGFMEARVPKWDKEGRPRTEIKSRFTPEEIASGTFVTAKDATRRRMCMDVDGKTRCVDDKVLGPLSGIWGEDHFENLVDVSTRARTLEELEKRELTSAEINLPWSDDYWPFYQGILGARYGDGDVPNTKDWGARRNYVLRNSVSSIINWGSQGAIDDLSPSEKYDLLVGDWNLTLTNRMWQLGANYYYSVGYVADWMGICEGWAAASFMLPRPTGVVSALAADGRTRLNFYPSDIKALASLLWAYGNNSIRFIGGRCEDSRPARDYNGRVVSQRCFDNNPGTFHLALTHQIGLAGRPLIMDATYDYEVWNHPVFSYEYTYFNPQTGAAVEKLADAVIPIRDFDRDKFSNYRSSNARYVVGIAMDVWYGTEVNARQRPVDSDEYDDWEQTRYLYDLELDSSGRIIGGEWYRNRHPDFLWVPVRGSRAYSNFDSQVYGRWDRTEIMPWAWRNAAINASSYSQPLAAIVESLIF